jgi:hypothetical protein
MEALLQVLRLRMLYPSIDRLASADSILASRGFERLVSRWRKIAAMEVAI